MNIFKLNKSLVAFILFCTILPGMAADDGVLSGGGTESSPYLIEGFLDFETFCDSTNASNYWADGIHVQLTSNIDLDSALPGRQVYTNAVIGPDQAVPFEGTFNGNGHVISNLRIDTEDQRYWGIGLFGNLKNQATISKLGVSGAKIECSNSFYAGILFGKSFDSGVKAQECFVSGSVTAANSLGVFCGNMYRGTISDCFALGKIETSFGGGGFCGTVDYGTLLNCYTAVEVVCTDALELEVHGFSENGNSSSYDAKHCFWNSDRCQISESEGGSGITDAEMCDETTFSTAGWDFTSKWKMESYPTLQCFSAQAISPEYLFVSGSSLIGGSSTNTYTATVCYQNGSCSNVSENTTWTTGHMETSFNGNQLIVYSVSSPQNTLLNATYSEGGVILSNECGNLILPMLRGSYSGGSGTKSDPYQIASKADLLELADSSADYDRHFIMTADVELTGETFYNSLVATDARNDSGFQGVPFRGSFDGGGHTITGITPESNGNNQFGALFGAVQGEFARISNLNISSATLNYRNHYSGVICGYLKDGTIEDCDVTGAVSAYRYGYYVGGVCGYNKNGTISQCSFEGSVDAQYYSRHIGGICGNNAGTISACSASVTISGEDRTYYVGGICGQNWGRVSECFSLGSIEAYFGVGGICGYNVGSIEQTYSLANVHGNSSASADVGGLCGYGNGSVVECYSAGLVSAEQGASYVGGLCGGSYPSISDSFWDSNASGQDISAGGTGKTTSEMMIQSTFASAGWDFANTWTMDDYPRLKWETASDPETGVDHFEWSPIDAMQYQSVPIDVEIQAVDESGVPIPSYTGSVSLRAIYESATGEVEVPLWPTNSSHFVGGVWSGRVAVLEVATDIYLRAENDEGHIGDSTLFSVEVTTGVHYVDSSNATPQAPYTSWATAADNIQDAVDAAVSGETVLVTDGVYDTGGALTPGHLSMNRVCITNDIIVRSVRGPESTFIAGSGPLGPDSIRGVYMSKGALSGFTITNGHTQTTGDWDYDLCGGGINMYGGNGTVSDCVLHGNVAYSKGGGSYHGILGKCYLINNLVSGGSGGGCYEGTLNHCILKNNSARYAGGGSYHATLEYCELTGNSAEFGGGSSSGTLRNCTLTRNSASEDGGGAYHCHLYNCVVIENSAFRNGGGSYGDNILTDNYLNGNWAGLSGGGSYGGILYNCTLTDNSSLYRGGGCYEGILRNCIVYFNSCGNLGDNWYDESPAMYYCCTTPDPGGSGNITNLPMFVSNYHIHENSPCVAAGGPHYESYGDIDNESWPTTPSIGCDAPTAPFSGALSVSIVTDFTNVSEGHELQFYADIAGAISSNRWTFGDGSLVENSVYINHAWPHPGNYTTVLTAWNDDHPDGVSSTTLVQVVTNSSFYVDESNSSPSHPFSSWKTAATNIQDAVNEAMKVAGSTVWVTDGTYDSGGSVTPGYSSMNRVCITKKIAVRSVNGPDSTFIVGEGPYGPDAVRGVFMTSGILSGFTITNGHTRYIGDEHYDCSGGGINMLRGDGIASNCVLHSNSANFHNGGGSYLGILNNCFFNENSAKYGGGSYGSILEHCIVSGNSAPLGSGGGSYNGTLNNCTVVSNSAGFGGGSSGGILNNCALYDNTSEGSGGGNVDGILHNCVITGNSSHYNGGGTFRSTLNNCTLASNEAKYSGGGVYEGRLINCIVWNNSASESNNVYLAKAISSCAPNLLHGDAGNITNAPLFINATGGDHRLRALSPCVDAGINEDWMYETSDFMDNPRILNGTVDMGAYETLLTFELRALLQGSYDMTTHAMATGNNLPLASPYKIDRTTITALPSNAADWVLVELVDTNNNAVLSKSAFLNTDGQLISIEGDAGITAEVSAGKYYIVLKYRNHLAAMSAQPVAFTNILTTYDFTTGLDKYAEDTE